MTVQKIPAWTEAKTFFNDMLREGDNFGASALFALSSREFSVVVYAPGSTASRVPISLEQGQGYQSDADKYLITDLVKQFPKDLLVVRLPLASVGDAWLESLPGEVVPVGGTVYATARLDSDPVKVHRVVTASDSSFSYVGAVIERSDDQSEQNVLETYFSSNGERLRAIFVGAFDGEGFVLASASVL